MRWERPWTSMLVFTVAALGMSAVPPAAGACEICHEIPIHPLLSQGTVFRWLHEKTKRHGLKSLIQNGPTFAQNPCTSCAYRIM